ncbi:hypothetical protein GGR51DRAFT_575982 [Nemania sp. FL0031]|nr:hypothetical protein GGR51DRAFT_575982 [Nemania sp. FL0031]
MPKDAAVFTKSKPKGAINFQPFEDLDELSLHRVRKFQVYPLGKIREYSRHIPYNSGKKDFFEKTGRESFEVFQYVFKVPGDDAEYAVMWDYNVGLVRMTPFFKCCKYPKTTPAKMLNSNPGLKEITHSITGGSIMAQGYWMPYQCAKAVCATFCHNISGALIPIFGPEFPALCAQVDAPEYSRMVIDPAIVIRSTREAEYYRHLYSNAASSGSGQRNDNTTIATISPKRDRRVFRSPFDDTNRHHPRYRVRKTYVTTPGSENSPYTTDTDGEISPVSERSGLIREPPQQPSRFLPSSFPSIIAPSRQGHITTRSSGWTPANAPHPPTQLHPRTEYQPSASGPSPWLSAIPRFTTAAHLQTSSPPPYPSANVLNPPRSQPYPDTHPFNQPNLRPLTHKYPPAISTQRQLPSPSDPPPYSSQHEPRGSPRMDQPTKWKYQGAAPEPNHTSTAHHIGTETRTDDDPSHAREDDKTGIIGTPGADKNAALLLMNLSVRDRSFWTSVRESQNTEDPGQGPENRDIYDAKNSRHTSFYNDRCRPRIVNPDDNNNSNDRNGQNSRYQSGMGASTATRIGSDGVSSETTSPFGGTLSRPKRIRSNSM